MVSLLRLLDLALLLVDLELRLPADSLEKDLFRTYSRDSTSFRTNLAVSGRLTTSWLVSSGSCCTPSSSELTFEKWVVDFTFYRGETSVIADCSKFRSKYTFRIQLGIENYVELVILGEKYWAEIMKYA